MHRDHDWVPLGERGVPQFDDSKAGPTATGGYRMAERLADKWYIIRACRLCTEVWWQEYDPAVAMKVYD